MLGYKDKFTVYLGRATVCQSIEGASTSYEYDQDERRVPEAGKYSSTLTNDRLELRENYTTNENISSLSARLESNAN